MSHYRKIDTRIWNDAKFQSLSDAGKLGFFLLLTHPNMTALGAMRGTPEGLAADLKEMRDAFPQAFQEVLAKGMAEYDPEARLIALPNFVKYNPPTSPNVLKAWVKALEFLPECKLKTLVIQRAVAFAEGMSKGFAKAVPQALREAMRYPESRDTYLSKKGSYITELGTAEGKRRALGVVNGGRPEGGWDV